MEFYPFPLTIQVFSFSRQKEKKYCRGPKAIMQLLGEGKAVNS